jgi:hypothetical protein
MSDVLRKGYPQDVTDEEWSFVLPYLLLSREDSQSRRHSLRELFNGVRLYRTDWQPVAVHAARFASVACGVSADATLDGSGCVRDSGRGCPVAFA